MSQRDRDDAERRLLVLAPSHKDAALAELVLGRAGVPCACCADLDSLCNELLRGAAAVVIPEEFVSPNPSHRLARWLRSQQAWSDLPVLVLARRGADSEAVAQAMDLLGNVTVLERPIRVAALVSAARSAVRARHRQYQLREHIAERERTAEELLANDRRKDEFLAMLAHELRNPLAPIVNSIRLLGLADLDPKHLATVRDMMDRQVGHMVRLVDDLMEISRITRGKIELRREVLDLGDALRAAIETIGPAVLSAKHELTVDIPSNPFPVEADPVRLAQVLTNVLTNAVKYTDPGGCIHVRALSAGGDVEVHVSDTGRGIPPEKLPHVFDLFMQVENDAARTQGGLGIGLTLVKRLTEMHGGSVSVASEGRGFGSEFTIRFPLLSQPVPAVRRESGSMLEVPDMSRLRVLIVDDNRDAADSLAEVLKLLGADTDVVYSGPEAIRKLASFRPSAILLDIGMPGMDGHEVARRIRERPELAGITLIAMTGWGQEQDRMRTRAAGFDHHLTKPADVEVLASLLFAAPEEKMATAASG